MRYVLFLVGCWLLPLLSFGQREWDTWCVGADTCATPFPAGYAGRGSGAQLQFGPGGPRLAGNVLRYGSGAVSDAQGNLLFYTDGLSVYDRRSQVMPGGQHLADAYLLPLGISLAQFVALHPVPGQPTQYYLFYFKGDNTPFAPNPRYGAAILHYAIVDLQANGGYGAVVQRDKQLIKTNLPKVTLVRHANNVDFWVVTQGVPDQGFRVFQVSSAGVNPQPVTSLIDEAAYANGWVLRASPDGQRLVSEGNRI